MFAYDYPAMGIFWSMLYFFIFFLWLMLLFRIFGDIFRSEDLGGLGKTVWVIFVIIVPFLGVFVYLIARGGKMTQRNLDAARAQDEAMKAYIQQTAGTAARAARPTSWPSSPS